MKCDVAGCEATALNNICEACGHGHHHGRVHVCEWSGTLRGQVEDHLAALCRVHADESAKEWQDARAARQATNA